MTLLQSTCERIRPLERTFLAQAQAHLDSQTKPQGSLGLLEDVACRLVAIAEGPPPKVDPARIYTCAGDHGVAAQGVSLYPQEVTRQMVQNFVAGGAAINVLTRTAGVDLKVVDAGCLGGAFPEHAHLIQCKVAPGTADFSLTKAMTRQNCLQALENGIALAQKAKAENITTLGCGEMGIANSTSATALFCAYLGLPPAQTAGPGTGLPPEGVRRKIQVIEKALHRHSQTIQTADPVAILAALGGFEIATLAGLMLGGASLRMPVVVDGFISVSASVAAQALCPLVQEYVFFSHASAEPGFAAVMERLGQRPLLDLKLRLGEGTGAALAIFLLRSAANLYTEMATFASAGVSSA